MHQSTGSKRQIIPCLLALGAASSLFAADPAPANQFTFHDANILGTSMDLRVAALFQADADRAHKAVIAEINRLNKILSTYDPSTDLAKINATTAPVKVAPEVIEVLRLYDLWQTKSKGAFSGKLGSLIALWKNATNTAKLPDKAAVAAQVALLKPPLWTIDTAASTVRRTGTLPINIDSLGKGFIVSRAADAGHAAAPTIRGLLLDIGGDITAIGSPSTASNDPWAIGVADAAHPADNAVALTTIRLSDMAVATSGGYARTFAVGTQNFSHILDPRTGYPVDCPDAPAGKHTPLVVSATVIAKDNAIANALATSLCILTPEESLALLKDSTGAEALILLSDGKQIRSPGFAKYEGKAPAVAVGKAWPNGANVSLTLQQITTFRDRPYMAIWIENDKGDVITTLERWGNRQKYLNSLSAYNRATRNNPNLQAVTRATRPAGKYTFTWDGKDSAGNPVPAGTYKVVVEAAYEHNGHSTSSATILCGDQPAQTTIPRTQHFEDVPLSFATKKN